MRLACLASLLVASVALSPVAAATRTFPVGGFDRVRSNVPFDVHVHTGGAIAVHAVGADDLLARLRVGVRNGELVIDAERGRWFGNFTLRKADRVVINVTMPRLAGAALSGPGDMAVDAVRGPAFGAALSGPGNMTIAAIETARADVSVTGPGDLTLAGRSGSAHIEGRGPGDVHAERWTVDDVAVELMGPGAVAVTALRSATVRVVGPGNVRIGGRPHCRVSRLGPGSVRCGS